jgi:hypothetical protein
VLGDSPGLTLPGRIENADSLYTLHSSLTHHGERQNASGVTLP